MRILAIVALCISTVIAHTHHLLEDSLKLRDSTTSSSVGIAFLKNINGYRTDPTVAG